jgi:polysaccharide export outer membrane protein
MTYRKYVMKRHAIHSLVTVLGYAAFGCGLMYTLVGCSHKYVTPRSEVIAEAQSQGLTLPSAEQDRELFFKRDTMNSQRLLAFLAKRTSDRSVGSDYRLGANDEVEINVFDVPELNLALKVRDSGFITLPLIGAVKAIDQTESELQDTLKKRLVTYIKDPQVSVFISKYGSQHVAVIGAVKEPGSIPLEKGSNSLVELVSEAGGLTEKAGGYITFIPAEVTGLNVASDVEARAKLSLASYETDRYAESGIEIPIDKVLGTRGGIPLEIPVRGGDMVIIPEAGVVTVDGEVQDRGAHNLGQRMTLLGALAAARGITYAAKVDEVEVIRDAGENQKARLIVNLDKIAHGEDRDITLRDGDIVVVPSDYGRKLRQDTYESITGIINFGVGGQYNVGR